VLVHEMLAVVLQLKISCFLNKPASTLYWKGQILVLIGITNHFILRLSTEEGTKVLLQNQNLFG